MTANGLDDELAARLRDLATALREDWDDDVSDVSSIAGRIRLLINDAIGSGSGEHDVPITADRAPGGTLRHVTASVPTLPMESDDPAVRDMLRAHRLAMHVGALAVDSRSIDRVKAAEQAENLADRLMVRFGGDVAGSVDAPELIDCRAAGLIWTRSDSWWRSQVGEGRPIPLNSTRGNAKLFAESDAAAHAKRLGIARK